jgi:hypothetical protein
MALSISFKQPMHALKTTLRTWRPRFVPQEVVGLVNKTDSLEDVLCSNSTTEVQVAKHGLQLDSNPIKSLTSTSYHLISIRDISLDRCGTRTHSNRFSLAEHALQSIDGNGGGLDCTAKGRHLVVHVVGSSNHIALQETQTSLKPSQPTRNIAVTGKNLAHNGMKRCSFDRRSRLGKILD